MEKISLFLLCLFIVLNVTAPLNVLALDEKATFYQHINYGGYAVSLPVGEYNLSQLKAKGILNDDISSIQVSSGYVVTIYEHDYFQGSTRILTANTPDFRYIDFNDKMSSVKISLINPNYGATLYQNTNYGGYAISLPAGDYTLSQLNARGIGNDEISSLRVSSGYTVTVYENDNFTGRSWVYTKDKADLDQVYFSDYFNDEISSLKISLTTSTNAATLYQHANYGGYSVPLTVGAYTLSQLKAKGMLNDDISSLKVGSGYRITIYVDDNFGGEPAAFESDFLDLKVRGFNDRLSSVKVIAIN